jgi:hypothetical protein
MTSLEVAMSPELKSAKVTCRSEYKPPYPGTYDLSRKKELLIGARSGIKRISWTAFSPALSLRG